MRYFLSFFVAVSFLFNVVLIANAHEYQAGDLIIEHPVIPATVRAAPVAAGYLKIINGTSETERLLAVKTSFSEKSQIHTMEVSEGVMRMRPLADGIEIPAGETVVLKQGGLHLMFMKLREQMEVGQLREVTLTFENAGDIDIKMLVLDPSDIQEDDEQDHSSHSGHTH